MAKTSPLNLRMTVYSSLFTALIIIGGYLSFPIPMNPVPVVLSDFFVLLAGLLLGASWGFTSVAMFIFLGALGLPVFAGGKAGLAVIVGPTGGFLFGFLAAAAVIGWIAGKGKISVLKDLVASFIAGVIVIYSFGVIGIMLVLKTTLLKALAIGVLPFLPGAVIKVIAAVILAQVLRPLLQPQFKSNANSNDSNDNQ